MHPLWQATVWFLFSFRSLSIVDASEVVFLRCNHTPLQEVVLVRRSGRPSVPPRFQTTKKRFFQANYITNNWLCEESTPSTFFPHSFFDATTHLYKSGSVRLSVRPSVRPSVPSCFQTTNMAVFEGAKLSSDIISNAMVQWVTKK